MKAFNILFQSFETIGSQMVSFESELEAKSVIELLRLDDYQLYQFIQSDFIYNMSIADLEKENIPFMKFERTRKTWFGLFRKTVIDILIEPKKNFFYPYQYGNYLYIFTKKKILQNDFQNWLDQVFYPKYAFIDESFDCLEGDIKSLIDNEDYLIATNHDFQKSLGIIGKEEFMERVISKLNKLGLDDYWIEDFD